MTHHSDDGGGDVKMQGKNSIVIVPTVFVNNVAERGGISTAAVLSTICAGYADKTAPEVQTVVFQSIARCPCWHTLAICSFLFCDWQESFSSRQVKQTTFCAR